MSEQPKLLPNIYQLEGLEPRKRKYEEWFIEVSAAPKYDRIELDHGEKDRRCGVCGARDTVCTFHRYSGSKEPSSVNEYECLVCGNYTRYYWNGW